MNKKKMYYKILLIIFALTIISSVNVLSVVAQQNQLPVEKHFEIHARQWAFEPSIIEVNQGDRVVITLISDDVSHGLYIEGYDVGTSVILKEGSPNSATFSFIADKPGTFTFRCNVTCGSFHPFMTGRLIVRPNSRFNAGVILSMLITISLIFILYKRW